MIGDHKFRGFRHIFSAEPRFRLADRDGRERRQFCENCGVALVEGVCNSCKAKDPHDQT